MKFSPLSVLTGSMVLSACAMALAGPLDPPPGPISSTLKPLAEVEPRTVVNQANTPGDADSLYVISKPGSYYLAGNLAGAPGKSGIKITASNVTLDLMGFDLDGAGSESHSGVLAGAVVSSLALRNGSIHGWGVNGVDFVSTSNCSIIDIRATANSNVGIAAGTGTTIHACEFSGNNGGGMYSATNAVITQCNAYANQGAGIYPGIGSTVSDCTCSFGLADGITVTSGSVVSRCTAMNNAGYGITGGESVFTDCTAEGNYGGLVATDGCTVTRCIARNNKSDGLISLGSCLISFNDFTNNGTSGTGAGIHIINSDNRLEANNCTGAKQGILADAGGNVIIRNTCSGNTVDWAIAANNVCGPIIDRRAPASAAVNGFSAPSSLGSADPNANFSY